MRRGARYAEAGITWRNIQEAIDPHICCPNHAVLCQLYGWWLTSVNAHGRYVNQGPVVLGSLHHIGDGIRPKIHASRSVRPESFMVPSVATVDSA